MVSREYGALAGAGGVKDVVHPLSESLARWTGRSVHVVIPCYGFIDPLVSGFVPLEDPLCPGKRLELEINMDLPDRSVKEVVRFRYKKENKVHLYLIEAERYADKGNVYVYTEEEEKLSTWKKKSEGHYDYFAMNVLHQKAVLELIIALSVVPDIIHCHDGHTALLPALLRECNGYSSYFRSTGCLVTLHNAGYGYHQEVADIPYALSTTGLPTQVVGENQLEQKFDPLLVAGQYGIINTVSENYARELQETKSDRLTGWLGHELKTRGVIIEGVTNGIDPHLFGPQQLVDLSPDLFFDLEEDDILVGKKRAKETLYDHLLTHSGSLQVEMHGVLANSDPKSLLSFVGRLNEQKGVDILLEVLPVLLSDHKDVQMVVMGNGLAEFENKLTLLAEDKKFIGQVCFLKGYSPELANRVFASGDFFVVPSRYEPCGLTDFIAQLNGNIPVVHHVGGLVKVLDGETGIAYHGNSPESLLEALRRALSLDSDTIREMQRKAVALINRKFTWKHVMHKYLELYKRCYLEQKPCE